LARLLPKSYWAVAVAGLEHLGRLRVVTRADRIEQLANDAKRVHLVIVLAGRKGQKLRSQRRNPGGVPARTVRAGAIRPLIDCSRTALSKRVITCNT
jgi:hypothetical protein